MEAPPGNAEPWLAACPPETTCVVLVRHGRTLWNHERRFLGRTDLPLDEEGLRQAQRLADRLGRLPIDAIYASPLRRAHQTAAALGARLAQPVHPAEALVELSQGELEGQPGHVLPLRYPEFLARWVADPATARVPGGETLGECQDRGLRGLRALVTQEGPGRTVVVVSHQMVIASVLCHVLGLPLRLHRLLGHQHTAFSVLRARGEALELVRIHDHGHLG